MGPGLGPGMGQGASGRIRTCGTWYRKPVLYPLSYGGIAPLKRGCAEPYNRLTCDVQPARESRGGYRCAGGTGAPIL